MKFLYHFKRCKYFLLFCCLIVPAAIKRSSSNTVITEGSNVTLHCNATGNPTPNIIWRRNAISTVLHQGQSYIMYNINRNQAGNYICSASNGIGNKTNVTIAVTVHCKLNLVFKT